ncbi:sugar kinase [Streptomyces bullii]|uniref:Sugar kinase n=1 Tax=Streptomyces bullii TaxID=349910 RepID=A0ABW0UPB1_9ACTN
MTTTGPRDVPGVPDVPGVVDVVALGESMVTFLPGRPGRLADVPSFERGIGGAESNVACVLAAAGHTTRWVSRVGADGFGDHLVEAIGAYGVDVSYVRRDPARPTGIYFRTAGDRATDAHEVAYYRTGSAASAMAVENTDLTAVRAGRVLHLSGITAALSDDCFGLLWELTAPGPQRPLVSFDVNFRPGLWRDADGPRVLLDLARRADLVFVGADEARAAWGLHDARAVRDALPEPELVVVKQGSSGATAFGRDTDGRHVGGRSTDGQWTHVRDADDRGPGRHGAGGRGTGGRDPVRRGTGAQDADGGGAGGHGPDGRGSGGGDSVGYGTGGRGAGGHGPGGRGAGGREAGGRGSDAQDAGGHGARAENADGRGAGRHGPGGRGEDDTGAAIFVPALQVDVLAAVGAGDAFAAGFLSATLRGLPLRDRLRHGHLMAAAALTVPGDLAAPPARGPADRLAALDDAAWGRLRLGPGWTDAVDRAEEEVRTP